MYRRKAEEKSRQNQSIGNHAEKLQLKIAPRKRNPQTFYKPQYKSRHPPTSQQHRRRTRLNPPSNPHIASPPLLLQKEVQHISLSLDNRHSYVPYPSGIGSFLWDELPPSLESPLLDGFGPTSTVEPETSSPATAPAFGSCATYLSSRSSVALRDGSSPLVSLIPLPGAPGGCRPLPGAPGGPHSFASGPGTCSSSVVHMPSPPHHPSPHSSSPHPPSPQSL